MGRLSNETALPLFVVAAIAAWFVKGIAAEAQGRVSKRIADWLFPLGQPLTYRLGKLMLGLARRLAPTVQRSLLLRPLFLPGSSTPFFRNFHPELSRSQLKWDDLEAAAAELEVDQQRARQIAKPVRFVWPLLLRALGYRFEDLRARLLYRFWLLCGRPFLIFVFFGFLLLCMLAWAIASPFVGTYKAVRAVGTSLLLRTAIRRLPADMEEEERRFWIAAMRADAKAVIARRILTRRFAVDLWLRGRLHLPDRSTLKGVSFRFPHLETTVRS